MYLYTSICKNNGGSSDNLMKGLARIFVATKTLIYLKWCNQ